METNLYDAYHLMDRGDIMIAVRIWLRFDPLEKERKAEEIAAAEAVVSKEYAGTETAKRCCYAGCSILDESVGRIAVCQNRHQMHPVCFYSDLRDKLRFPPAEYMCYECDDKSVDVLYRAIVNNIGGRFLTYAVGPCASMISTAAMLRAADVECERMGAFGRPPGQKK